MAKKITADNGNTVLQQAAMAARTATPLTGTDALTAALEKAKQKKEAVLLAGQAKVLGATLKGSLTTNPRKKVAQAQAALLAAALSSFTANKGAVGEWTKDVKTSLAVGRSAASEVLGVLGEEELVEAFDIADEA